MNGISASTSVEYKQEISLSDSPNGQQKRFTSRWMPGPIDKHIFLTYVVVWVAVTLISESGFLYQLENLEIDSLLLLTAPQAPQAPVVVVTIDEDTLEELNIMPPFPREMHARLIDRLNQAGAKVIAFDIAFNEPTDLKDDQALADSIKHSQVPVILAGYKDSIKTNYTHSTRKIQPFWSFKNAGALNGNVELPLDDDLVIRHVPMAIDSFWKRVLEAANLLALEPPYESKRFIQLLPPGSITRVHYYQALEPDKYLAQDALSDKIVLVGWATQVGLDAESPGMDMHATPYFWSTGSLLSGVEIHAAVINTVYCGTAVVEGDISVRLALVVLVALVTYPIMCPWLPLRSSLYLIGGVVGLFLLGGFLFISGGIWVSITGPIFGLLTSYSAQRGLSHLRERKRVQFIRDAFSRYVSADIVNKIMERPEELVVGGERREVTFIFTDLTGFTKMTELIEPEQLVDILRRYFDGMCSIVQNYEGTIERLSGDGLVAFFNAPVDQDDHAQRAIQCSIELDLFSQQFEEAQREADVPIGTTRIGVNTGWVTVGNFGSETRFHYTAMGDAINTAARLEAANKYFGTRLCTSGITKARCQTIIFRPIGDVVLAGKQRAIGVFEPITHSHSAYDTLDQYLEAFEALRQNAPEAIELFDMLAQENPMDKLAGFHLQRIRSGGRVGVRIQLIQK
jgi:adenylate cyclase